MDVQLKPKKKAFNEIDLCVLFILNLKDLEIE